MKNLTKLAGGSVIAEPHSTSNANVTKVLRAGGTGRLKVMLVGLLENLIRFCFTVLPFKSKAKLTEEFVVFGKLDYPRSDIKMTVDSRRGARRLSACKKEPETVRWIEDNVRPGDVFYDIGANVGAYSFIASAVGGVSAKVYSFEPGAATYAALSKNVLLNRAQGRVIPLGIALSERTALNDLVYSSFTAGEAQHNWGASDGRQKFQPIPSFKLDDLIEIFKIEPPNHIKIDVDGHEMNVLAGAKRTLAGPSLRSLLIEIDEIVPECKDIYKLLADAGFKLSSKHHRSAAFFNCIFIKK